MTCWYEHLKIIRKNGFDVAEVSKILVDALRAQTDEFLQTEISRELGQLAPTNQLARSTLCELMKDSHFRSTRIAAAEALYAFQPNDPYLKIVLNNLLISERSDHQNYSINMEYGPTWLRAAFLLLQMEPDHEEALTALIDDGLLCGQVHTAAVATCLIVDRLDLSQRQLSLIVEKISTFLSRINDAESNSNGKLDKSAIQHGIECANRVLFHCSENLNYKDFYHAWNAMSTNQQLQGLHDFFHKNLLRVLEDSQIIANIRLITVDSTQFSNPNNPTEDIYIEMLEQGCPESPNHRPTELTHLKTYWRLDLKSLQETPLLVIYNSQNPSHPFSETFLQTLSTFGGLICVITGQNQSNLQTFSPQQPDVLQNIVKWLERDKLEA